MFTIVLVSYFYTNDAKVNNDLTNNWHTFFCQVSLSWVYLFMGILIGSAVVPIALCMSWARLTGPAMVSGAIGGTVTGLTVWLSVAASRPGGLTLFFENTGA